MSLLENEIRLRLQSLQPLAVDLDDQTTQHAGHAGNQGGGHFNLRVKSSQFSGKSLIIRHRMVYALLQDLIPQRIHALSIHALADDE